MKRLFILCAFLLSSPAVFASDIYFANTSQGSNNGASCANAYGWQDVTHGINVAGNWTAGNVLHLCGTLVGTAGQTGITVDGSGSAGNVITIKFENGAGMQAPYWGDNPFSSSAAAITCTSFNYITVDGGTNGIIQNTANGTNLTYQHGSAGINFGGCGNVEIKNLAVGPIYAHQLGDSSGNNTTMGITVGTASNISVHNNAITNAYENLNLGFNTGSTTATISLYNNILDYGCKLLNVGDASSNSAISAVNIYGNTLGPHQQVWTGASTNDCHNDGIIVSAVNSGSTLATFNVYNNVITTDMCSNAAAAGNNCTAPVFFTGYGSGINIFNNVIQPTSPPQGMEAMIRLGAGYLSGSPLTGGNESNIAVYNNIIYGVNVSGGINCDCAGIKTTNANSSTQTGFKVFNNAFIGFRGGNAVYLNEDGTFDGKFGANINNNDYYTVDEIGVDFTNNQHYNWASSVVWTASNGTNSFPGYDGSGSIGNPNLSGTYHPLAGSVLIGLGSDLFSTCNGQSNPGLGALCNDGGGNARPSSGVWDAAVFNFQNTPAPYKGIQMTLLPPTDLHVVSIDGVPVTQKLQLLNRIEAWMPIAALAYQPQEGR